MSASKNTTEITLLDQKYMIACDLDEQDNLVLAANLLNKKLKETRGSGKVYSLEKLALITALNIANDFLKLEKSNQAHSNKVAELNRKMDSALNQINTLVKQNKSL